MRAYRIELAPDDNGTFLVTCPALPEVTTFGETRDDGINHARNAIEEALAARIARGVEIPFDSAKLKRRASPNVAVAWVPMRALPELKVELYGALKAADVSRAELARRLDWNRNSVDRLFRLDHASRLDQIETAAAALGLVVRAELAPAREDA